MSVIVKDVKMPENCRKCIFRASVKKYRKPEEPLKYYICPFTGEHTYADTNDSRMSKCPIREKPSDISMSIFDKEETYTDCTVQVLTNTVTGEVSVGWRKNKRE